MKDEYNNFFEKITTPDSLEEKVIRRAKKFNKEKNIRKIKTAVAAAVSFAVIFGGISVASAESDNFYYLMYMISPSTAQFFVPVQKSCEDNGIRMEVIATYIHDSTAEIYIAMEDLIGNRIDNTIDLNDSYSINCPYSSTSSCRFVNYDAEKNRAEFLITIDLWENKKFSGDKVTFRVREFLSQKKTYKNVPVSLENIASAETMSVSPHAGGNGPDLPDSVKVLVPSQPDPDFPVDGIALTGIGWVDGRLHIQTAVENPLENDNHGAFILTDENGIDIDGYYYAFTRNINGKRVDYQDYMFDIPFEDIQKYTLSGDFVTSDLMTKGNWKLTFPMKNYNSEE